MYPFGDLPGNLIAFCAFLRSDYGFGIGPRETHDAARALEIVDLADERRVRNALRPVLSGRREHAAVFDGAFNAFFFPGPRGVLQSDLPSRRRAHDPAKESDDVMRSAGGQRHADPSDGAAETEEVSIARASYSALESDAPVDAPVIHRADAAWREAARTFVRRLHLGLSRRWRPAPKGQRFDLRRTLRASLQTGGEPLTVRWLRRPRRAPRFVVLIDGSRSMSGSAATALELAVALASATMRVEAFTFSTALRRITEEVRRAAAGQALRLDHLQHAWDGGTTIGACLRSFLQRFGDRLLGRDTVVIVASDGLDVGHTDLLANAMRELRRRSAGIIWLNPLLDTAGYEPTANGMRAARPYITTFAAVAKPADLAHLARERRGARASRRP
jgi:uncharacterized protein